MLRVFEPLRQDEEIVDGKDTKDNCVVWEGRTRRKGKRTRKKKKGTRNREQEKRNKGEVRFLTPA